MMLPFDAVTKIVLKSNDCSWWLWLYLLVGGTSGGIRMFDRTKDDVAASDFTQARNKQSVSGQTIGVSDVDVSSLY